MEREAFVDLLLEAGALTFGDFVTKSGRRTPYFVNFGHLRTGRHAELVGRAFADEIVSRFGDDVDAVFGPAYKGIPLAVATAIALRQEHGLDVGWCFDRKEVKDHGEGGLLVGHPLSDGDRVVIVEDVTTAGTSIRETVPKLRAVAEVELVGLVVALDRREKGPDGRPALAAVGEEFGMTTTSILDIVEVIELLDERGALDDELRDRIDAYRIEHGA